MSLEEAVELVVFTFQNEETGDIMVQKAPACTIGVLGDKRDLNYDKYFKDGDVERNKLAEWESMKK